jgi:hypothetical protein
MEIAITISNDVLQRAEEKARGLGISLNELYARALNHFLESHGESEITRKLNEIYEHEDSSPDPVMTQLQFATLTKEDW